MIPTLYDEKETAFTTNGIGKLCDAASCYVTEKDVTFDHHLFHVYVLEGVYSKSQLLATADAGDSMDYEVFGLPVLKLTGSMAGVTKEVTGTRDREAEQADLTRSDEAAAINRKLAALRRNRTLTSSILPTISHMNGIPDWCLSGSKEMCLSVSGNSIMVNTTLHGHISTWLMEKR